MFTFDLEVVKSSIVAWGRRAVGKGNAASVQAGVGLSHGAYVDGAPAEVESPVAEPADTSAPSVRHDGLFRRRAAVPRVDAFSLDMDDIYILWNKNEDYFKKREKNMRCADPKPSTL